MYLATQFQVSTWAKALEKQPKQQKLLYNSNAGNFEFSSILRVLVAHTANSNCIEGSVERTKTIAETGQVHRPELTGWCIAQNVTCTLVETRSEWCQKQLILLLKVRPLACDSVESKKSFKNGRSLVNSGVTKEKKTKRKKRQ